MQLTIESKGIELTDAIRGYAEEKMTSLEKFADIIKADVDLGSDGHQQKGEIFFCEAHIFIAGKDFFVKREEVDMYKAIDKVKDHLKQEIATWRDRQISTDRRVSQEEESAE
jgi:putative sigma-54 modulation protein